MGRRACFALAFLALVCGVVYFAYRALVQPAMDRDPPDIDYSNRVPVALNRGPDVLDGFQGEVHPVLHGQGALEVIARWEFDRNQVGSRAFLSGVPPQIGELFMSLDLACPRKTYTARDLSRFLPAKELSSVGQMWALDLDTSAEFLKQFLPAPSMHLVAKGRRAGPDGAFAVVRAVSPTHLDILFRIHAEFDVVPNHEKWKSLASEAWYSPACFLGRLVIDRKAGTVAYFWLGLPDSRYNVHVTVAGGDHGEGHGWMRVDRMELLGGSNSGIDGIHWEDQIETADAHNRLAKVFYTFREIDWIAFDKVQEAARTQKKPIFVVAAMGALDNQTC